MMVAVQWWWWWQCSGDDGGSAVVIVVAVQWWWQCSDDDGGSTVVMVVAVPPWSTAAPSRSHRIHARTVWDNLDKPCYPTTVITLRSGCAMFSYACMK